jgi:hypothetical protein
MGLRVGIEVEFQNGGEVYLTLHKSSEYRSTPQGWSGSAFNHVFRDLVPIDVFDVAVDEAEQEPPISLNLRLKVFDVQFPLTLEELRHLSGVLRAGCYFVDVVELFVDELKVHLPSNVVTPAVVFHVHCN